MAISDNQLLMLRAEIQTLIGALKERFSADITDRWNKVDVDTLDSSDLLFARKVLHEILYAPPTRG